ncbi:Maf family protein [Corynebacterium epidermidicanis]|uniref:Nucleoside triphosphate pyrophosphatase n=1 Tax=Corynebacterium epidermidicanis TaxID=1050174 RepID=A0A0G3GML5_9CORY|nr:nucleoside triphosphate pyrophosphatase [Corynebacterium epidermidicanis]AKK02471.1 MAF protein [Corynebacterium epidermidicanis]
MRIVLASASPSRKMILENAGINPVISPADVDEDAIAVQMAGAEPADIVAALAQAKAQSQATRFPDDVLIGCDSMLLLDGVLQGKPHTVEKAIARWHAQRGRTAELLTGHYLISPHGTYSETIRTEIRFADVSDRDISAYAHSGEPLECAGAFTLEALGGWFIDSISGDQTSVIGLSLPLLRRALYSFGYDVSEFWSPH